tara:strand:+ start:25117 stop:26718 length:1602 start_codon:yes stop_codon:yes gene_type:complete
MTDNMTTHPLKQLVKGTFSVKLALSALLSISVLAQPANAVEQEWWFDVEVILFERNLEAANISEKFKQSRLEQPTSDVLDLLTPYIKPDVSYLRAGLTYCRASKQHAIKTQYEHDFAFPLPVVAPNQSSLTPANKQSTQYNQGLAVNPDVLPEENFEYKVATTDIFTHSNDKELNQTVDSEDVNPSNLSLTTKTNLARPPIAVEFIEWQVPSEFPCAYAEQIDPSFASISVLQNSVSGTQSANHIERVPEIINGTLWHQKRSASLLPSSTMNMNDLYEKIKKQRNISPILHINWRQQVKFGLKNSQTIRLFAGKNYANQFDANGLPLIKDTDDLFANLDPSSHEVYIPEQELALLSTEQQQALTQRINGTGSKDVADDLFARIDAALADDSPINFEQSNIETEQQTIKTAPAILKELWQIDGGITVYLRKIGRVPYLHIDSNLDFRQPIFDPKKAQPVADSANNSSDQGAIAYNQLQQPSSLQPNFLQSANFNQLRRVISKQVHYFDHPLFGMIVKINRYRWPNEEAQPETDN